MRKRNNFTLDERTIKCLKELADDDCTTMSATIERLILTEYKRRLHSTVNTESTRFTYTNQFISMG